MAGMADDGDLDVSDAALEDELAQLLSGADLKAPRRPKPSEDGKTCVWVWGGGWERLT